MYFRPPFAARVRCKSRSWYEASHFDVRETSQSMRPKREPRRAPRQFRDELDRSHRALAQPVAGGAAETGACEPATQGDAQHGLRGRNSGSGNAGSRSQAPNAASRYVDATLGILSHTGLAPSFPRRVELTRHAIRQRDFWGAAGKSSKATTGSPRFCPGTRRHTSWCDKSRDKAVCTSLPRSLHLPAEDKTKISVTRFARTTARSVSNPDERTDVDEPSATSELG